MALEMTKESRLVLFPLGRRQENEEEVLIGREDMANYILLPNIGVDIIDLFAEGKSVGEIETLMEERFGEPVDVLSFAQDLVVEYQFVHQVDGDVVNEAVKRRTHFGWLPQAVCQLLFHPIMIGVYVIIILSGLGLAVTHTRYLPHYLDVFTSKSVSISYVTAFVSFSFLLFLHEMAHLLAARSLGVTSNIELSHRLYFMVAQTNMSNIVLVDPKKRNRAYLAGMGLDAVLLGISIWLLFANDHGWIALSAYLYGYIKMLMFSFYSGFGFQFMFYMRTDLYYVFTNHFRCRNLHHNTRLFLRNLFRKWTPQQKEEWEYVDAHEKKIVQWYVWFYLFGFVVSTVYYVFFSIPQIYELYKRTFHTMSGHPLFSSGFWDGMIVILLASIPLSVVCWSWIRTLQRRRADRKRRTMMLGT